MLSWIFLAVSTNACFDKKDMIRGRMEKRVEIDGFVVENMNSTNSQNENAFEFEEENDISFEEENDISFDDI